MSRHVLSIGQCVPDQSSISSMLQHHFDVTVSTADYGKDAFELLKSQRFDLVLINRKLDADYSDGMLILEQITSDEELQTTPVMLVSNFADWQEKAVAAGARYGFGKAALHAPETLSRLTEVLG